MKKAQDLVMAAKQQIIEVSLNDAEKSILAASVLIDVREPGEYQQGHIAGAVNIPRGMLEFKMDTTAELEPRDTAVVIYCKTSGRAALSAAALKDMGYTNVVSISGGYDAWVDAGKPIVKPNMPEFG